MWSKTREVQITINNLMQFKTLKSENRWAGYVGRMKEISITKKLLKFKFYTKRLVERSKMMQ